MERLGAVIAFFLAVSCLALVEANVFSLGTMIEYMDRETKTIFEAYRRFDGYGCYCGIGGEGTPLDKVDCCCYDHDQCYDRLVAEGKCPDGETYSKVYKYTKGNFRGKLDIQCKMDNDDCGLELCKCDQKVAQCLAIKDQPYYNHHYQKYDRSKCKPLPSGMSKPAICRK